MSCRVVSSADGGTSVLKYVGGLLIIAYECVFIQCVRWLMY